MGFQSTMQIRKGSIWSIDFYATKITQHHHHVRFYAVAEGSKTEHSDGFVIYDEDTGRVGYDNPHIIPKYVQEFISRNAKEILAYRDRLASILNNPVAA